MNQVVDLAQSTPRASGTNALQDKEVVGLFWNIPMMRGAGPGIPQKGMIPRFFSRLKAELTKALIGSYQVVYGGPLAAQSLIQAILKHGTADRCEIFCMPQRSKFVASVVKQSMVHCAGTKIVKVYTYPELLRTFGDHNFSVWFDPAPNLGMLCYLRALCAQRLFPVTITHHTLSYHFIRHGLILPILLADSHPCDSIICTSRAARTALSTLLEHVAEDFKRQFGIPLCYRGRLDLIPLGVDTDLFRPRDKVQVRRGLGLPADAFVVLYLGRLSATDKMDLLPLLQVFRDLVNTNANRKLLLIIAGSPGGEYATSLKGAVTSLGLQRQVKIMLPPLDLSFEERHLLYAAADVFVSPADNIQESFGLTTIEAMACGVPQVVADWDGYRDTVQHAETGFLVSTYWAKCDRDLSEMAPLFQGDWEFDHGSLAQSVVVDLAKYREYLGVLIENDHLRATMGQRSRQRAVQLFEWKSIVAQYELLWKELARSASELTFSPTAGGRYTQPDYFRAFAHYATAWLDDESPVRLTRAGKEILNSETILSPNHPASDFRLLDPELLRQVLLAFEHSSPETAPSGEPQGEESRVRKLGSLIAHLDSSRGCHPDYLRRHVMWLIKYGFVDRVEQETR